MNTNSTRKIIVTASAAAICISGSWAPTPGPSDDRHRRGRHLHLHLQSSRSTESSPRARCRCPPTTSPTQPPAPGSPPARRRAARFASSRCPPVLRRHGHSGRSETCSHDGLDSHTGRIDAPSKPHQQTRGRARLLDPRRLREPSTDLSRWVPASACDRPTSRLHPLGILAAASRVGPSRGRKRSRTGSCPWSARRWC